MPDRGGAGLQAPLHGALGPVHAEDAGPNRVPEVGAERRQLGVDPADRISRTRIVTALRARSASVDCDRARPESPSAAPSSRRRSARSSSSRRGAGDVVRALRFLDGLRQIADALLVAARARASSAGPRSPPPSRAGRPCFSVAATRSSACTSRRAAARSTARSRAAPFASRSPAWSSRRTPRTTCRRRERNAPLVAGRVRRRSPGDCGSGPERIHLGLQPRSDERRVDARQGLERGLVPLPTSSVSPARWAMRAKVAATGP